MVMVRENIFFAIDREREYQDNEWGTIQDNPHSISEWLDIMTEELYEVILALKKDNHDAALAEILQVIAVGVACLEQYKVVER